MPVRDRVRIARDARDSSPYRLSPSTSAITSSQMSLIPSFAFQRTLRRTPDAARPSRVARAGRGDGRRRRAMARRAAARSWRRARRRASSSRACTTRRTCSAWPRQPGRPSRSTPTPTRRPKRYEIALLAAGAAVDAVERVMGRLAHAARSRWSRPPGHHAERDRAMGFCLFNNVAVAAAHARTLGARPRRHRRLRRAPRQRHAAHLRARSDVLYVSTHQYPVLPGHRRGRRNRRRRRARASRSTCRSKSGRSTRTTSSSFDEVVLPVLRQFEPDLCWCRPASTRTSAIRSAACG